MVRAVKNEIIFFVTLWLFVGKTIDNGKNGHKILKLAGNVGTDDI
jgi:hypothetical protein